MRALADSDRIDAFIDRFGAAAAGLEGDVYLTGGATAVLIGWRDSTLDVDIKLIPDSDQLLREIPRLKQELDLNIELASPIEFIPVPDGWQARSPFIRAVGALRFHHFDPTAQALAKAERGHDSDRRDVQEMISRGLVNPAEAIAQFVSIESQLYRFPAIDPPTFRRSVIELFHSGS
jgi:hypothetical protein